MARSELHIQLQANPADPYPETDATCMLHSKSKRLKKYFTERFVRVRDTEPFDTQPYVIGFICPALMDVKLQKVHDFMWWLEDLVEDSEYWVFDNAMMRVCNLDKRFCEDVRNVLRGTSFSLLTRKSTNDRLITPVVFVTYRHKDIRDI